MGKKSVADDSSDSSDSEARLRSAVDPSFEEALKNQKNTANDGPHEAKWAGKGKRAKLELTSSHSSQSNIESADIQIAPEVQKFVAKKLSESLERSLKEKRLSFSFDTQSEDSLSRGGVKLFSDSRVLVRSDDEIDAPSSTKRRKKPDLLAHRKKKSRGAREDETDSSDDEDLALKEAAVSSDWVLEKKGVFEAQQKQAQCDNT